MVETSGRACEVWCDGAEEGEDSKSSRVGDSRKISTERYHSLCINEGELTC